MARPKKIEANLKQRRLAPKKAFVKQTEIGKMIYCRLDTLSKEFRPAPQPLVCFIDGKSNVPILTAEKDEEGEKCEVDFASIVGMAEEIFKEKEDGTFAIIKPEDRKGYQEFEHVKVEQDLKAEEPVTEPSLSYLTVATQVGRDTDHYAAFHVVANDANRGVTWGDVMGSIRKFYKSPMKPLADFIKASNDAAGVANRDATGPVISSGMGHLVPSSFELHYDREDQQNILFSNVY